MFLLFETFKNKESQRHQLSAFLAIQKIYDATRKVNDFNKQIGKYIE